jgi:drug/metabolite transporter (DMT)-like permease
VNVAHTRSVVFLVVAALCWSLGGLLIKSVAATWPALAVAGGRGLIAALFLLATNRGLRFHFSRAQVVAAVLYAATTTTFCVANTLTTAANAILLQYTAPVWVALLGAWLLGERTTRADWFTIGAVLAGLALFFAEGLEVHHLAGNLIAIGSGVCFAGMVVAMRRQKDTSASESIILGNLIAFAVGLPFILRAPALDASGWAALAVLGVVQLGISYWLYARAMKHVTALEAVLIPVIEPILNPLWVLLALGERPTPLALTGGAIVLGAVTLRAVASVRAGRRAAPTATA